MLASLKNSWRVINVLPSTIDDRTVKLVDPDCYIIDKILKEIDPEQRLKQDYIKAKGVVLNELIRKGEI